MDTSCLTLKSKMTTLWHITWRVMLIVLISTVIWSEWNTHVIEDKAVRDIQKSLYLARLDDAVYRQEYRIWVIENQIGDPRIDSKRRLKLVGDLERAKSKLERLLIMTDIEAQGFNCIVCHGDIIKRPHFKQGVSNVIVNNGETR